MEALNLRDVAMSCAKHREKVTGFDYQSLVDSFSGTMTNRMDICDLIERKFIAFESLQSSLATNLPVRKHVVF